MHACLSGFLAKKIVVDENKEKDSHRTDTKQKADSTGVRTKASFLSTEQPDTLSKRRIPNFLQHIVAKYREQVG